MDFYYGSEGVIGFKLSGSTEVTNGNYLYRKNLFGDITGIINESGELVYEYAYSAFGKSDKTEETGIGAKNPFRYRGYYYDEETSLYYLKSRYYDPETGRFITIDDISYLNAKISNGLNLYAYCRNNPIYYIDVLGNIPFASTFTKYYTSALVWGWDSPIWGRINYTIIDDVEQTDETGIFYAYSSFGNDQLNPNGGAGINLWGWFSREVGYSSEDYSVYYSVGFTPWLTSTISIGANGITLTYAFTNEGVTHEFSIGIGWGFAAVVVGIVAVVLSLGQALPAVAQFFSWLVG